MSNISQTTRVERHVVETSGAAYPTATNATANADLLTGNASHTRTATVTPVGGHSVAAPVDGREEKLERVETVKTDKAGNVVSHDVREDKGGEDPGMNFQDKRPPGLVPDPHARAAL
ncbi:uncharacterized protein LOC129587096 [Paramacrobiotus metropolitanus]|uniref:uncharacterized protein LOC129587096 n=1 Tax=Paramacrobiotus metropolitanus TaxID=2943436 RepID=UPI0024464DFB|nr:uncharacterized protein LOC129587096 [Paramacrobiotus metropolitanus]